MYYTSIFGVPTSLIYQTEVIMSGSKKLGFGGDSANNYIITNTDSPEDLEIHADQDILLTPDNNVGIGTTTPTKKLEVAGDISGSSDLYIADDIFIGNRIEHIGDPNTYIDFATDNISIVNEGANLITQNSDGLITIGTDAGNDNQLFISNEHNKTYISAGNKFGIGTEHPPTELTVNGDVSGSIGYLNTGHHGSQTRIKILPRDFHISDDTGRPLFIEEDVVGQLKMRVSNTSEIYASVEIPTGFKATHVMLYGSDASLTVTVVEGNINSASVTAKGSGNPNTEINITDVTATDTNFLWIGVSMANAFDYVYGGYVTIEKA